jgi:hypothetical protein
MKLLRTLAISALLVTGFTAILLPAAAQATPADEKALERVEKELDTLWTYVDDSKSLSNDVFYPEFVKRARHAQDEIAKTEQELTASTETREAKKAIDRLREDVEQIQVALIAWRAAAEAKDTLGFEDASFLLQSVIEIYNEDVDAYNSATHGSRAVVALATHIAPAFFALALSAMLLAIAFYYNNETDDVVGEIKRQLRWHVWFASLFALAVSLVPVGLYLFSEVTMPVWGWWALALGLIPLLLVLARHAKLRRLAGRP